MADQLDAKILALLPPPGGLSGILYGTELCVDDGMTPAEIARQLGSGKKAIRGRLSRLMEAGKVTRRTDGNGYRYLSLDPAKIAAEREREAAHDREAAQVREAAQAAGILGPDVDVDRKLLWGYGIKLRNAEFLDLCRKAGVIDSA